MIRKTLDRFVSTKILTTFFKFVCKCRNDSPRQFAHHFFDFGRKGIVYHFLNFGKVIMHRTFSKPISHILQELLQLVTHDFPLFFLRLFKPRPLLPAQKRKWRAVTSE